MERYLKDEPKVSLKKLATDPWDLFATPARILEEFNYPYEHNLDSLSTSSMSSACSGASWDSALSCAVVVKKESCEMDDEDNSDSCEEKLEHHNFSKIPIQIKTENAIELRVLARTTATAAASPVMVTTTTTTAADPQTNVELLPTLTPPSSPESIRTTTEATELALLGHQGIFKVATAGGATTHLPRSAIVRVTTAGQKGVSVTRYIQVSQGIPAAAAAAAIAQQRNTVVSTALTTTATAATTTPVNCTTSPASGGLFFSLCLVLLL